MTGRVDGKERRRMTESDAAVVERTLGRDRQAYAELVRRYQPAILGQTLAVTGRQDEAENLAQEVFIKAYLALPGLRQRSSFAAWLFGIARNVCFDWLRQRERDGEAAAPRPPGSEELDVPDPATPTPAETAERRELHRQVLLAVASLPTECTVALTLKHQAGLTCREIAERLGVPVGTVTSRLSRAHQMLREALPHVAAAR